eukprot:TRINITY_DN26378_c0_g1_i1.p1 TRINITY_DN26378_c0_g1~~TRINITY_DN26378_c0_g1_i1.p1  ORF type:complete len:259 (+),score=21.44 TRINITY_DN26378_c0_g1_i1:31-777(+)
MDETTVIDSAGLVLSPIKKISDRNGSREGSPKATLRQGRHARSAEVRSRSLSGSRRNSRAPSPTATPAFPGDKPAWDSNTRRNSDLIWQPGYKMQGVNKPLIAEAEVGNHSVMQSETSQRGSQVKPPQKSPSAQSRSLQTQTRESSVDGSTILNQSTMSEQSVAEKLPWYKIQGVRSYEKELRYQPKEEVNRDFIHSLRTGEICQRQGSPTCSVGTVRPMKRRSDSVGSRRSSVSVTPRTTPRQAFRV